MRSAKPIKPKVTARSGGVSLRTPGVIAGSVLIGAAGAVFLLKVSAGGTETFSVMSLFGFFVMIVLAVAAITLSVIAISISRPAVCAGCHKTASAPVADGQIETLRQEIRRHIEEAVKSALADHLAGRDVPAGPAEEAMSAEPDSKTPLAEALERAETKYRDFKNIVLLGIANYPGVQPLTAGAGHSATTADGLFALNHERVAVCTFACDELLKERFFGGQGDRFPKMLHGLFHEIKKRNFSRVFMVFDRVLNSSSPYANALNAFSARVDAEIFAQFELLEGSPDIVIPELTERVSRLMQTGTRTSG